MSVNRWWFGVAAALLAAGAAGQEPRVDRDTLELTMRVLPEGARTPDAVTRTIELPRPAAPAAIENGQRGLERANETAQGRDDGRGAADSARGRGPASGRDVAAEARERGAGGDVAAEARERGREAGREAADQARENRDDAGRGEPGRGEPGRGELNRPDRR